MAFLWNKSLSQSEPIIQSIPKAASTAFTTNSLVDYDGSGAVTPSTAISAAICGVYSDEAITTASSDYAQTTAKKVIVDPLALYEADVTTGTLTLAMVGTTVDLTDADGIDVTASAVDTVLIVGFISASKALVQLNSVFN